VSRQNRHVESPPLSLSRCAEIARWVRTGAGIPFTENDIADVAADMQRAANDFPPFTPEQRDRLTVLLRPDPAKVNRAEVA
jgi:hypothetical protein